VLAAGRRSVGFPPAVDTSTSMVLAPAVAAAVKAAAVAFQSPTGISLFEVGTVVVPSWPTVVTCVIVVSVAAIAAAVTLAATSASVPLTAAAHSAAPRLAFAAATATLSPLLTSRCPVEASFILTAFIPHSLPLPPVHLAVAYQMSSNAGGGGELQGRMNYKDTKFLMSAFL
jgi:hypothetical protein